MKVLAVDPGREKTGIAIVGDNMKVYFKDIIASSNITDLLFRLLKDYSIDIIIIGDGTYSEEIRVKISQITDIPIKIVNESYTTVEAEKRYRKEKQNLLFRLINWKPARPLDDYVAVILAERYLK